MTIPNIRFFFNEISALSDWILAVGDPAAMSIDNLAKATIVALCLSTVMQAGELHHLIFNVFMYQGQCYLRFTDETNHVNTNKIGGCIRDLVLEHMRRYRDCPAPYCFHNQGTPALRQLTEDRQTLPFGHGETCINIQVPKAHSVRGAGGVPIAEIRGKVCSTARTPWPGLGRQANAASA